MFKLFYSKVIILYNILLFLSSKLSNHKTKINIEKIKNEDNQLEFNKS
jgi:hypothetical protein